MPTFVRASGWAVLFIFLLAKVSVADVRLGDRSIDGCDIHIYGQIKKGDLEKLKGIADTYHQVDKLAYKRNINALAEFWPRTVCLDSPGGSYTEGVNIALEVNNYFATRLLPNSNCLSACALIFMSGTLIHPDHVLFKHYEEACYSNCEGWKPEPKRTMSPSSVLGFHAPYVNFDGKKTVSTEVVQEINQSLLRVSSFLQAETKNNFPPELASEMMSKGPDEVYYIDEVGQLTSWRIDLDTSFSPTLDVDALKRAWIMYVSDYDYSDGGYGSLSDTKYGIKGPVSEPNGATGWGYNAKRGRTQSGADYIQAGGIGREASVPHLTQDSH
ncbi:hypothetical protein ROE7235_03323 [Roseibaca ekhonensis]|uniref:Uncharacterized protein n=1 Tax=Roseinatronobacter ekhonensis TaxID=254356 RepID=A0A3B0MCH2_9RHOB|nr:hypothetical protein [Roseibaca ekhonensis]SUZ33551.1 hypothetical protein ROE7235_03323 [Roseibaca ekhonensis]